MGTRCSLRWLAPVLVLATTTHVTAASRVACLDVPTDVDWKATGVDVRAGDAVCMRAHAVGFPDRGAGAGRLSSSLPGGGSGTLMAKIGAGGAAFPVEDGLCFLVPPPRSHAAQLPGELLLSVDEPRRSAGGNGLARVAIAVDEGATSVVRPTSERSGFDRLDERVSRGACRQ